MRRGGLLASWWIALTFVPFGFLAWGALVYAGVRARRGVWIAFGILYLVLLVLGFTLLDEDRDAGTRDDVALTLWFVAWVAPLVHAFAIRRAYLERITGFDHEQFGAAGRRLRQEEQARRIAAEDPTRAVELGVGRPDLPGSFHGGVVDLNNAGVKAVAAVPGIGRERAAEIVRIREEIGGFSSLEDVGHVLALDAPTLDRLRRDVIVLPRGVEPAE